MNTFNFNIRRLRDTMSVATSLLGIRTTEEMRSNPAAFRGFLEAVAHVYTNDDIKRDGL